MGDGQLDATAAGELEALMRACLLLLEQRGYPAMRALDVGDAARWIVTAIPARRPLLVECRLPGQTESSRAGKYRMAFAARGFLCLTVHTPAELADGVSRIEPSC